MPRITSIFLLLLLSHMSYSQDHGVWNGNGEYLPEIPFSALMKKMGAEKKLIFDVNAAGIVSGQLIATYNKSKALIPHEGGDQHFTLTGKYNAAKGSLLLIITHFRSKPDSSESYLTFNKPDSIYYDLSSSQQNNKTVTTGVANKILNSNTTPEWVGSFRGGGLAKNIININMHILPLRIRFESAPKPLVTAVVNTVGDVPKMSIINAISASTVTAARETRIMQTITLDTSFIKLDLYDNGEIDGDIATLILDGKTIINKQRLAATAATVFINLSKLNSEHMLELFADNMGSIPPNTALLILTCKKKRYEINLTSTETVNGAVKLMFKSN